MSHLWFLWPFLTLFCAPTISLTVPLSTSSQTSSSLLLNSTQNSITRCQIPTPGALTRPVNLARCQIIFSNLLNYERADSPSTYVQHNRDPIIISQFPCAISLDFRHNMGIIKISNQRIVAEVSQILNLCRQYGDGGWAWLQDHPQWIIIVDGVGW